MEKKTCTQKRERYRSTFSLDPALGDAIVSYRKNGGNPSSLVSRLLTAYFSDTSRSPDPEPLLPIIEARIQETKTGIEDLCTLLESVQRQELEKRQREDGLVQMLRQTIRSEFGDAMKNPAFWKRDLRLDGFDPNQVISNRTRSLAERHGVSVLRITRLIGEEIPDLAPGN
ncbi:MAG: hypothetical protein Q7J09_03970 [Methanocalculus sp.]|uniref:hypothetical protein n=1 Tax=Methanocalculus sp. TaxID=2004547 RepID=UPI0027192451|nr:hypothetical protein [Methanocalculus sp.]MDO9539145.1 hypothetical protein [Methanocalculus sp.]